jgi:hypothetical protein
MKNIMWIFSAIIMMVCGIQNISDSKVKAGNLVSVGKSVMAVSDEDPVAMRSHVRTSGGLAIASASVSLTPSGTSTPLYTGTTDASGDYDFTSVNQGNYVFTIARTGYLTKNVNVSLSANTVRTDTLLTN